MLCLAERVFYKENVGAGLTLQNFYMTFGGTVSFFFPLIPGGRRERGCVMAGWVSYRALVG